MNICDFSQPAESTSHWQTICERKSVISFVRIFIFYKIGKNLLEAIQKIQPTLVIIALISGILVNSLNMIVTKQIFLTVVI